MILLTDTKASRESIKALLLENAIRPTAQRVEIADVLLCKPQHLSADQILARVNVQRPRVSKATVYNTLNLFVERGLVREVLIDSGKVFYDSNTDVHHHLYHEDTGMLQDIAATAMSIARLPELPAGTVTTGVDVIIRVKRKP